MEKANFKTQFTMLGVTGSGKTCYLLGMYKKMLGGMKGYSLTTDDDTDVDLRRRYARMNDASLGNDRFPNPTNQQEILNFTLEYAYASIMSFAWIDYPGGHLDEKKSGDAEEYEKLTSYIKDSGSLFICVDGGLLQGDDDNEDKSELVKEKCSSLINPFLSTYLKENTLLPPTAIIVTKFDMCEKDVSDDDLTEILKESFSPLFTEGGRSNRFVAILPVSLGNNISEDNNRGLLKPKNFQLPIYMGIWFALHHRMAELIDQDNNKVDKYNYNVNQINTENSRWFFKDKKKIKSLSEDNSKILSEKLKGEQEFEKALSDSDRLLDVLNDKIKAVFFNGEDYGHFADAAHAYLDARYPHLL